ncbi:putative 54S ribosomal protein L32, mitochondrial [Leucoagaricus sp. SymC.cos]|nr:putative 54S ribosomal protein L32, mitochondrial [Leucoagaricus sp. SymC.cos]
MRTSLLRPFFSTGVVFTSLAAARPAFNWSIPSLQSLLNLFPPFLLAVPKKKTSHSRKAMRAANKGLKDKQNIVNCPGCGGPKLSHHLCANCYSYLNRAWKSKNNADIPDLS